MTLFDDDITLSVLLPVRDGARFIEKAVRSTLSAMPSSSELVVVDDGSRDESTRLLSQMGDPRLRIVQNSSHAGLVGALNFGLKLARGRYVARMDSDDICMPWRFTLQLRELMKFPDIDFLFSTALVFGKPIAPYPFLPQLPRGLSDVEFKLALTSWNPAVHPTMVARRSAMMDLGGYRNVPAEDLDLWLRAALRKYQFKRLALPTIGLRLHGNQVTRTKAWISGVESQTELDLLRAELAKVVEMSKPRRIVQGGRVSRLESQGLPRVLAPWKWHKSE